MSEIVSVEARTRREVEVVAQATTEAELDAVLDAAKDTEAQLARAPRAARVAMLMAIADALEANRDRIVELADRETALGPGRLQGEVDRTSGQFRHFASVVSDGAYLEIAIEHSTAKTPDVRRWLRPLGTVGVFGASNFPLAFSVPGGDTASALAAGCPVVVKAHPGHPATSIACAQAVREGLAAAEVPPTALGLIHGFQAGARLVTHNTISAIGFTGSTAGGRALFNLAAARREPIPFYGELGSVNPVVVTEGAALRRGREIANGFVDSFTAGGGQFCTKPGVLFVPQSAADGILAVIRERLRTVGPVVLTSSSINDTYLDKVDALQRLGVRFVAGHSVARHEHEAAPAVAIIDATELCGPAGSMLAEECFGPFAVVARYSGDEQLLESLRRVPGSLSAALHAEEAEIESIAAVLALLEDRVGRIVWNGFPTGVAVSWATHHGGPYPASTSIHTSVGASAIRRWMRPVAYQNLPQPALAADLRDSSTVAGRRVDGDLR